MLNIKDIFLNLFFPKHCLSCQREGDYLCPDCQAILDVSRYHQKYATLNLDDLYFPLAYQGQLVKSLIQQFKYEPFVKDLAKTLSSLIIEHFQLLDNQPDFAGFLIAPIPLEKKRLKWRGFNQSQKIAEELARHLGLKILTNILIKTKATLPQMELVKEKREENIKGAFTITNPDEIRGKKILLVDDVYTSGATMEECALALKTAGAGKIIGLVVARD